MPPPPSAHNSITLPVSSTLLIDFPFPNRGKSIIISNISHTSSSEVLNKFNMSASTTPFTPNIVDAECVEPKRQPTQDSKFLRIFDHRFQYFQAEFVHPQFDENFPPPQNSSSFDSGACLLNLWPLTSCIIWFFMLNIKFLHHAHSIHCTASNSALTCYLTTLFDYSSFKTTLSCPTSFRKNRDLLWPIASLSNEISKILISFLFGHIHLIFSYVTARV